MSHDISKVREKDSGVRRGGADVCALGGVKAVRWGCVLWMPVLAVANDPRRFRAPDAHLANRFDLRVVDVVG